jgi:hypothetical protein
MSATQNCTVCQEPLKGLSLSQIVAGTYSFPCPGAHKIHQSCLVQWTNKMHTEEPTAKTLNCPECRHVTKIPTKHSAQQISTWVKTSRRLTIAVCTILGLGIGLWIAGSSFAEGISKIALKTLHVAPSLVFSAAGGALGFLGSYFLISSNSESRLTRVVTASYNRVYGTEILPRDIWMYQSGFFSAPKDYQLQMVQEYCMQVEIGTLIEELKLVPFERDERSSLQTHSSLLESFQTHSRELANRFFETLASNHGDLYAQVKRRKSQLLQSTGNTELKEQLSGMINEWLCETLVELDKTTLDSKMAARITLVKVLQKSKEKIEFRDARKAAKWTSLISSLQRESHNSQSLLMIDLERKLPQNFFQQPLTLLLWNPAIEDGVFQALIELRKAQFVREGFNPSRE